jgi:hypothetical protein
MPAPERTERDVSFGRFPLGQAIGGVPGVQSALASRLRIGTRSPVRALRALCDRRAIR